MNRIKRFIRKSATKSFVSLFVFRITTFGLAISLSRPRFSLPLPRSPLRDIILSCDSIGRGIVSSLALLLYPETNESFLTLKIFVIKARPKRSKKKTNSAEEERGIELNKRRLKLPGR